MTTEVVTEHATWKEKLEAFPKQIELRGLDALRELAEYLQTIPLTTSQKAALGAQALPPVEQYFFFHLPADGDRTPKVHHDSKHAVCEALAIGLTSLTEAARLRKQFPDSFERVLLGATSLNRAYLEKICGQTERPPRPLKPKIAKPAAALSPNGHRKYSLPSEGTRKRALMEQAAKRRMINGLSLIGGACRGVAELNLDLISPTLSGQEKLAWVDIAQEASQTLKQFADRLRRRYGTEKTQH